MKKLKVYLADYLGFCGGVKRAVNMAFDAADKDVYSLGDIVHNESVVNNLKKLGVRATEDTDIKNSKVIIRSHGVDRKSVV